MHYVAGFGLLSERDASCRMRRAKDPNTQYAIRDTRYATRNALCIGAPKAPLKQNDATAAKARGHDAAPIIFGRNIDADMQVRLPDDIWQTKYRIITDVYGIGPDSFQARTTPQEEAFWALGKGK
jgi:hypothetical protein